MLTPAEIAAIAYKALDDKKAKDIKVLKTDRQTVLADYFVICNGTSSTHIKALVDEVDKQLSEAGEPLIRRDHQIGIGFRRLPPCFRIKVPGIHVRLGLEDPLDLILLHLKEGSGLLQALLGLLQLGG